MYSSLDKMKMAAFAAIFLATGVSFWLLFLPDLIFSQSLINAESIAVHMSVWWVPALIGSPMFLLLAYGFLLKIFEKDKGRQFQYVTNAAIAFALIAMVVRVFSGFVVDDRLGAKGYSKCIYYTAPANFSPTAWVRAPEYCIEQTGVIRRPLMDWLQALPNGGRDVTASEVRAKAMEMLEAYKAGERFLD